MEVHTLTGSRPALMIAFGSGISALSGFLVMTISSRVLATDQNSVFLTYWAALFAAFAVLTGVQNEVTRAVSVDTTRSVPRQTRPIGISLLMGGGVATIAALTSPLWSQSFEMQGSTGPAILLIAIGSVLYAGHASTVGVLSGQSDWIMVASLTGGEAVIRLLATIAVALMGGGIFGFELAAVVSTATWIAVTLLFRRVRLSVTTRIGLNRRAFVQRMLQAMVAAAANALLVTGFPLLMSVTTDPTEYSHAAPLIIAVSVTRAPLLMPIGAFQSMVISWFARGHSHVRSAFVTLLAVVVLVAVVGGTAAAIVGPQLMGLVFGDGYRNSSLVLAALVVDAAALALLVLGGSVALALDQHRVNSLGWYTAVGVAVFVMFFPFTLELRTVVALLLGPIAGSAVHLYGVFRQLSPNTVNT